MVVKMTTLVLGCLYSYLMLDQTLRRKSMIYHSDQYTADRFASTGEASLIHRTNRHVPVDATTVILRYASIGVDE